MDVTAVRTTGIYCLPACGARPLPGNTTVFPSPAAAEAAGFRPCHRCRPYRVPLDAQVLGAPDLVCRAVGLILDGALDGGDESQLAARINISARHLRRIFDEHLGVTPTVLARSARAHLARRLLDDTDLPITQIAYAAGFGSLSQFNRDIRRVFRDTPTRLRRRRRVPDRLAADGGLTLRIARSGQVHWPSVSALLSEHVVTGVQSMVDDRYRRTITVQGDIGVLEIASDGFGGLHLTVHLPHWEGLVHVVRDARRLVGFGPAASSTSLTDPGQVGVWSAWERDLTSALTASVGPSTALRHLADLASVAGTPITGLQRWQLTRSFPSPRQVLGADRGCLDLPASVAYAVRQLAAERVAWGRQDRRNRRPGARADLDASAS